ncbi:hypothetical protein EDC32_101696 [Laceyella sacchari]|nr:hypothetical protein EDC32_101696 [Laceyella sacchari]
MSTLRQSDLDPPLLFFQRDRVVEWHGISWFILYIPTLLK